MDKKPSRPLETGNYTVSTQAAPVYFRNRRKRHIQEWLPFRIWNTSQSEERWELRRYLSEERKAWLRFSRHWHSQELEGAPLLVEIWPLVPQRAIQRICRDCTEQSGRSDLFLAKKQPWTRF